MALLLSALMFLFVASLSYLLGMKFWVSPQNMLERVIGEERQSEARHPSMAFRDALMKIGEMMPASPADLGTIQKRLHAAGLRAPKAPPGSAGFGLRVPEAPSGIMPALEQIRLENVFS